MNNSETEFCLASRWQRVMAAMVDGLFIVAPVMLLVFLFPQKEQIPELASLLTGLYIIVVLIWQAVWLTKRGQTVGKKVVKIRIVRQKDGQNGGFVTNVLLRCFVNSLIGLIPLYHLFDSLFILGEAKRCCHDRIAGTVVVMGE